MMQLIPDRVILVKTSVFVNSPSVFLCSFSEEKLGEAETIFKATNFMLISSSTVLILSEWMDKHAWVHKTQLEYFLSFKGSELVLQYDLIPAL